MNEVAEKKKVIHQGRNVRITRELKGLYQKDLGDKLNKQQSEVSRIESLEIIEDELLKQIALVLDVPVDFLKNFDLQTATKNFYNDAIINSAENSHDIVNQGNDNVENVYNYPITEFKEFAENTLKLQRELLEEKHQLDKENTLLKKELEILKKNK